MKVFLVILSLLVALPVWAENLNGPRFGLTWLDSGTIDFAKSKGVDLQSEFITQFGWQFEKKFFSTKNGPTGVVAVVPLVGGLEQDLFLPSVTLLAGLRTKSGFEFSIGPNLSASSTGVAVTVGYSSKLGDLNIPVNLVYLKSKNGSRISLMFGFNADDDID